MDELDEALDLADIYRTLGLDPMTAGKPDEDDLASTAALVAEARRFHRVLRARLNEAIEDAGFTYAKFEVLEALESDPNIHSAAIAHRLGTSRQAVTRLVRVLEDHGCLEFLTVDQGVLGPRLTTAGRAALARCRRSLQGFHQMFERLPPDARRGLIEALRAAEAAIRPPPHWGF